MEAGQFTVANALSILLTTEGLLFAALSLAASLSAPDSRRGSRLKPTTAARLGKAAVALLSLVAFGAFVAWFEIIQNNSPGSFLECLVMFCILGAILAQPVLAAFLLGALRGKS